MKKKRFCTIHDFGSPTFLLSCNQECAKYFPADNIMLVRVNNSLKMLRPHEDKYGDPLLRDKTADKEWLLAMLYKFNPIEKTYRQKQ